jgi:hypothetical protein
MARQFDQYGFNRQYRRNPSRKRNPFPYRLPFVPGFGTNPYTDPDHNVSAATASRYRQVIRDLLDQHAQNPRAGAKRKFDIMQGRNGMHETRAGAKRKWDHYLGMQKAAEFLADRQVPTNSNAKRRQEERIGAVQNQSFSRFHNIREKPQHVPWYVVDTVEAADSVAGALMAAAIRTGGLGPLLI